MPREVDGQRGLDIILAVKEFDIAPGYGVPGRWREQYIGRVMQHGRHDVFLATTSRKCTRDGALRDIERSLKLMTPDHLDLWLLHNTGTREEVNAVFANRCGMEAFTRMHDQRVLRFLGVATHYRPEPVIDLSTAKPSMRPFWPSMRPTATTLTASPTNSSPSLRKNRWVSLA